jgi:3-hydroxybutyryl-CoA dehydrogenase
LLIAALSRELSYAGAGWMAISSVGVVGAGTMGVGIAQITASAGMPVTLIDVSEDLVARAVDGLRAELARRVQQRELAESEQAAVLASISGSAAINSLANVDLVVEVVPDDHDLKMALLSRIDALVKPRTIIASGTSSISITRLAASISHPDRFIGMHFFTPVQRIGLVEIVRGLRTSDTTHDAVEAFLFQLGKSPITVKSGPGFLVNRILLPMINEAFFVLAEGEATATEIDQGMMLGYEHPIGPLALADTIGLDVLLSVMQAIYEGFADPKYRPCPLLKELVAAGYLGRKSGRGVYRY